MQEWPRDQQYQGQTIFQVGLPGSESVRVDQTQGFEFFGGQKRRLAVSDQFADEAVHDPFPECCFCTAQFSAFPTIFI